MLATPASAQFAPPPRHTTSSPDGVNYRTGAFSYSESDLAIGGPGDEGLSLSRTYNSATNTWSDILGGSRGWTHSLTGYVSARRAPPVAPYEDPPQPGTEPYIYSVTFGGRSYAFGGGSQYRANVTITGGPVGTYYPLDVAGSSLVFDGTNSSGHYVFTSPDNVVATFGPTANGRLQSVVKPDGTRLDYTYTSTGNLRSVMSNRGLAILFDYASQTACAVNLATTYVTATSACPAGAQAVTYGLQSGTYGPQLIAATKAGQTATYGYNGAGQLSCIKAPGQSACRISNTYNSCPRDPANPSSQAEAHLNDHVTSQVDAAGRTVTYAYSYSTPNVDHLCTIYQSPDPDYRSFISSSVTMVVNGTQTTSVEITPDSYSLKVTDPLGRKSAIDYSPDSELDAQVQPELNKMVRTRDDRGNVVATTLSAKPGSGLADIVTTASYPAGCAGNAACNKPVWTRDAKGNQTDYTYDPGHGGVLTETAPAGLDGIRAVKRYAYVQRAAWIRDSGGGYVQAGPPVWLLSALRTCRSTATVADACAGGVADEVTTAYEYGPTSGPNNLWLRGVAVTADGTTLRTCYGYDVNGNRIWETKPRAGLTVCQ